MDESIVLNDDNNEMIAIFEGWNLVTEYGVYKLIKGDKCRYHYELRYHSSWDWLMPVWEKAGKWLYKIRASLSKEDYLVAHRLTKQFIDACQRADISAAHYAVVESVKFINERTTKGSADTTANPH